MHSKQTKLGTRARPAETRAAILHAAMREFAEEGIAGARTDAIARAAGVNKALLYYYFQDKESLYGAVLDHVFSGLSKRIAQALDGQHSPSEAILAYVGAHFDYVSSSPLYPRVVYREMMRAGRSGGPHLPRLIATYFRPTFGRLNGVLQQGIESGEFRPVDPMHFVLSMVAMIVFYFTSTPVIASVTGVDPISPPMVAKRRAAVLDQVSAALFVRGREPSNGRRRSVTGLAGGDRKK
jgi:TetR/AcrR family transcriptional regulator